jgi:ferredoxin
MTGTHTRVSVDSELCIGSLECNRIAAVAFALDDDSGVSVPLPGAASTDPALLRLAARSCPTQAIGLTDAGGNDLVEQTA